MYRLSSMLPLTLLLGACAPATSIPGTTSTGAPTSITQTSTGATIRLGTDAAPVSARLNGPRDQVWMLLPNVYEALGIPAEINDPAARTYGTRRFSRNRLAGKRTADFVRCGYEGSGASAMSAHRIRLSIISSLQSTPEGGTLLQTEMDGSATPVDGTSTAAVRCVSKGELEQRIRTLIAERLGR